MAVVVAVRVGEEAVGERARREASSAMRCWIMRLYFSTNMSFASLAWRMMRSSGVRRGMRERSIELTAL